MPTVKEAIRRSLKGVKGHIAIAVWCEEDVIGRAKEKGVQMSHKVAGEILDEIDRIQDAELGITWDTLDCWINTWIDEHPHYRKCETEEE